MILYSYFRSSASYRVRLGFALKGLKPTETCYINLRAGEQSGQYKRLNPQGLVPALVLTDGTVLTQSLAILEYLEEAFPETPRLLPESPRERAHVRAIAQAIACEIQPLINLRTLTEVKRLTDEERKDAWLHRWIGQGLQAVEALLPDADFVSGNRPGLAECFILPQLFAARRFDHDFTSYPRLRRIEAAALPWAGVSEAHPQTQPDHIA